MCTQYNSYYLCVCKRKSGNGEETFAKRENDVLRNLQKDVDASRFHVGQLLHILFATLQIHIDYQLRIVISLQLTNSCVIVIQTSRPNIVAERRTINRVKVQHCYYVNIYHRVVQQRGVDSAVL